MDVQFFYHDETKGDPRFHFNRFVGNRSGGGGGGGGG